MHRLHGQSQMQGPPSSFCAASWKQDSWYPISLQEIQGRALDCCRRRVSMKLFKPSIATAPCLLSKHACRLPIVAVSHNFKAQSLTSLGVLPVPVPQHLQIAVHSWWAKVLPRPCPGHKERFLRCRALLSQQLPLQCVAPDLGHSKVFFCNVWGDNFPNTGDHLGLNPVNSIFSGLVAGNFVLKHRFEWFLVQGCIQGNTSYWLRNWTQLAEADRFACISYDLHLVHVRRRED